MSARPVVHVTRRLPAAVEALVCERFDAVLNPEDRPLGADGLQRALSQADGVLCTIPDRLTAEVFAAYPMRTRILAQFGVGTDNIDLGAARAHGITVTNTPGVLTDATADLAITLLLMTLRRAGEGERELRAGRWTGWRPTHLMGHDLRGRTLGIVGLGAIGRATARRAHAGFGMRVLGWSRSRPDAAVLAECGAEWRDSLDQLLEEADVVSLHVPSSEATRGLMDGRRLAQMRPGSWLINTARGDVVDDDALIAALRSRHLAGAGLDVFRGEPGLDPRYLGMEQVVLLPHLGSATVETREAMGFKAVENLTAFFAGRPVPNGVMQP